MEFHHADPKNRMLSRCALQQSTGYARAIRDMGATVDTIIARDEGTPVARMQVVTRTLGPMTIAWLPRGPVWADEASPDQRAEVLDGLPDALNKKAAWIIAPEYSADAEYFRNTALVSSQYVAELDLTVTPDRLLAAQHGKWRNRLRHAQSAGLRVVHRPFSTDRDMQLLVHEAAQRLHRHYRALPPEFVESWARTSPRDSRLFSVFRGNSALAYLLILLHKPIATYHIGWSGAEGRRFSAHNLGLWEAATWLARKGYERLDLGHVDTQNSPGLARFKIGSGARVRALGPTCLRLPRLLPGRSLSHDAA